MAKKIIGNTITTPMATPDWNQTDDNKVGFIKNKPPISTGEVAPTSNTKGVIGQLYIDTKSGIIYKCKSIEHDVYTWTEMADKYDLEKLDSDFFNSIY